MRRCVGFRLAASPFSRLLCAHRALRSCPSISCAIGSITRANFTAAAAGRQKKMASEAIASPAPLKPEAVDVSEPPKAGQHVRHGEHEYTTIKEGLAHILVPHDLPTVTDPKAVSEGEIARQSVFYNPIQQFNRDLSVLAIRAFGEHVIAARQAKAEKAKTRPRKQKKNAKRKSEETDNAPGVDADVAEPKRRKLETADGDRGTEIQANSNGPDQAMVETDQTGPEGNQKPEQMPERRMPFTVLDALSATGLRALRYAHELPFVTSVTSNDMSKEAVKMIDLNVKHNRLEGKIRSNTGNAIGYMYSCAGYGLGQPAAKYDVIDLDPYGTAAPFLDAALQAINDGGLLCVTCTDAGVFNSVGYLEKTYSQYGGLPLKGLHAHEAGLRLILHSIASTAARYGIAIEPLLSLSIDYYARVWVRVRKSPAEVKFLAGKTMLIYNCDNGCGAWQTQFLARNHQQKGKNGQPFWKHSLAQAPTSSPFCEHCGTKTHLAGPMYGGPLHNPAFIQRILSYLPTLDKDTYGTTARIEGMLHTAYEETLFDDETKYKKQESDEANSPLIPPMDPAEIDPHPFCFIPSNLSRIIHCQAPSDSVVRGALRHAGFRVTRSHTKPGTIRTDAPWSVLWEIMREWVRQKAPVKEGAVKEGTPGWRIMQKGLMQDDGKARRRVATSDAQSGAGEAKEIGAADADAGAPAGAASGSEQEEVVAAVNGHKFKVVFDEKLGRDEAVGKRLVRYQINPRANWGPMNRAK